MIPVAESSAGSGVSKGTVAELSLRATRSMPRRLQITLREGGRVWCSMDAPGKYRRPLAFATCELKNVRLVYGVNLWIESVMFKLSGEEAQQVKATFVPLGLRVESEERR